MTPALCEFSDRATASLALAEALGRNLREAVATRGRAVCALPGGNSPKIVFPHLAKTDLDWRRVTLTLIDDRWVPTDHTDSNERLVREELMIGAAAAAPFVSLKTGDTDPRDAETEVEERLAGLIWPLDAALLGMGEDGHVASLFPDDPTWADAAGRVHGVAATAERVARISLTPAALLDCRMFHLIAFGDTKRKVLDRALEPGSFQELPIRVILHQTQVPVTIYAAS